MYLFIYLSFYIYTHLYTHTCNQLSALNMYMCVSLCICARWTARCAFGNATCNQRSRIKTGEGVSGTTPDTEGLLRLNDRKSREGDNFRARWMEVDLPYASQILSFGFASHLHPFLEAQHSNVELHVFLETQNFSPQPVSETLVVIRILAFHPPPLHTRGLRPAIEADVVLRASNRTRPRELQTLNF